MTIERSDFNRDREGVEHVINELNDETERIRKKMHEQEEHYEKRHKPLPEKLYHVTMRENAQQIIREGLVPSELYFEDRKVVSLSDDVDFARNVANMTNNATPQSANRSTPDSKALTYGILV